MPNTTPIFEFTNRIDSCLIATQSTRDGSPDNLTSMMTAGTNGTRVQRVNITSNALVGQSVASKMFRLYIKNGSTYILLREINYFNTVNISTTTVVGYTAYLQLEGGLILPPNTVLYGGISNWASSVDTLSIVIESRDF